MKHRYQLYRDQMTLCFRTYKYQNIFIWKSSSSFLLSQLSSKTRLSCLNFFPTVFLDVPEDPFGSRQEDSSEVTIPNSWVESVLQRNRDLSFTQTDNQQGVFSRQARSFITEEILEALRKADRKGRDVVVGLSNACCKWGCSKSEISSLC